MENDDRQIGKILSRRDTLKLLGISSAAFLAGCVPASSDLLTETLVPTTIPGATSTPLTPTTVPSAALPACVVRPELTEGPYFVDERLNRSDIRSDPSDGTVREGLPLQLTFQVSQVNEVCTPLEGATVDIWHCDALGVYSDVSDPDFNTRGQKFLRGYQVTDSELIFQFF